MPLNNRIKKVLVIGAGPITIGQGCEFDYSGTQACKALKEEGCQVILVNSNPATIMTDPDVADYVYIEPIDIHILEKIIQKHRPDSLLPTMGGQTALNITLDLERRGLLKEYSVNIIGLRLSTIEKAENREQFKHEINLLGLDVPLSFAASTWKEVLQAKKQIGFPLVIRTSFTLGGENGGIVHNDQELASLCKKSLLSSKKLLIEESIYGWKEYELEVIRDSGGNCIVVCGIENLDPMGIHTGDSITIAPIQTLTDKEYQAMRTAAFKIMDAIGMTSGGCNVQFAINPQTGKMNCIEINPRVSRSSALASKATGYPIAKIATKIALGYLLDELENDLIKNTFPCSFEPVIDYVVVKMPFFNFDKFPNVDRKLTTHMKSIGEVMGIGGTFQEALLKAVNSLDFAINPLFTFQNLAKEDIRQSLLPSPNRLFLIFQAFRAGFSIEDIESLTRYDPWFLHQIFDLVMAEKEIKQSSPEDLDRDALFLWKQKGFSDAHLAFLLKSTEDTISQLRRQMDIHPVYKRIDSCSGEFPNKTAYMYSTYGDQCEAFPTTNQKIVILGSGPNRIGQGIEFDYCCVHAVNAVKELGYESIMINCNPATVSTDYDIADRLYLEPLALEFVTEILKVEAPSGVIPQMGGQTPLKIATQIGKKGVKILGTSIEIIKKTEDRDLFQKYIREVGLKQPQNGSFTSEIEAFALAKKIGYPLIARPSFIIGGSGIETITSEEELHAYLKTIHLETSAPILIERFLEGCIEVEVDAICDGTEVFHCGIIEHLDPAGIHSGDSVSFMSTDTIDPQLENKILQQVSDIGLSLGIIGIFNVQFVIFNNEPFVLEINPRASRTIPLLSKIAGLPFAEIATKCMLSQSLRSQTLSGIAVSQFKALKIPVFPFSRLGIDNPSLGPQMQSTGEVLCIGKSRLELFAKARAYVSVINCYSKKLNEILKKSATQLDRIDIHSIRKRLGHESNQRQLLAEESGVSSSLQN